ncbi:M23 family metallopeptidase [Treponema sp.]|uniref:M23 family metallopeptidase n=1 Tax=Treponema sp. TaxID=166 RepID=UPI0025E6E955|nr:M23 family metallopeptidase [Treponema sp.]MCR5218754.1 M23 family metallopeptidase [Treponema sp.]
MKKLTLLLITLLQFTLIYAEKYSVKKDNAFYQVSYESKAYPGDAEFVRMTVSPVKKSGKNQLKDTKASLTLYLNQKKIISSDFYLLEEKDSSSITMLTGLPLSTWWDQEDGWSLKITCSLYGKTEETLELPFTLMHKDFISETLYLDEKNTSIKTDSSSRRQKDIEKLNAILAQINTQSLWQKKAFTFPVTSKRRTAFFADRRIYKYNTGGSTTGLHHGIDYGIPEGTDVFACGRGKVLLAEDRVSTGYSVVIEHLPGLYSLYYHLSRLDVKEGDFIEQGEKIGLSGCTGLATGPHLHWEVRLLMQSVNPDFFLRDFTYSQE